MAASANTEIIEVLDSPDVGKFGDRYAKSPIDIVSPKVHPFLKSYTKRKESREFTDGCKNPFKSPSMKEVCDKQEESSSESLFKWKGQKPRSVIKGSSLTVTTSPSKFSDEETSVPTFGKGFLNDQDHLEREHPGQVLFCSDTNHTESSGLQLDIDENDAKDKALTQDSNTSNINQGKIKVYMSRKGNHAHALNTSSTIKLPESGNERISNLAMNNTGDGIEESVKEVPCTAKLDDKGKGKAIVCEKVVESNVADFPKELRRKRSRGNGHGSTVIGSSSAAPVYLSSPEFSAPTNPETLNNSSEFSLNIGPSNAVNSRGLEEEFLEAASTSAVSCDGQPFYTFTSRKRQRTQRTRLMEEQNNHQTSPDVLCLSSPRVFRNNLPSNCAIFQCSNYGMEETFNQSPIDVDSLDSPRTICMHETSGNVENVSRARQIEEDEMLARRLQEELFNEVLSEGYREQTRSSSHNSNNSSASVGSSQSDRFTRNGNPSGRRGRDAVHSSRNNTTRTVTSSDPMLQSQRRTPEFRSQIFRRIHQFRREIQAFRPRRNDSFRINFPSYMNTDMRIEMLEAMERASNGHMENAFLSRIQRDFNENDYEMLLALDENNEHRGASKEHINRLPTAILQSDAQDEVCPICLEMPKSGEVIRHLLCTHKFHQECIDTWLSKQATCPVCKSNI